MYGLWRLLKRQIILFCCRLIIKVKKGETTNSKQNYAIGFKLNSRSGKSSPAILGRSIQAYGQGFEC
jgi:hypothetical protein